MPNFEKADIADIYIREAAKYSRLSREGEVAVARDIESKGNKILWAIFRQDPELIIGYFSKQEPKYDNASKSKDEKVQVVQELFAKQNLKFNQKAEHEFYSRLEQVREIVLVGSVYKNIVKVYIEKLKEQKEQILYGEGKNLTYQKEETTVKKLQDQHETIDELIADWRAARDIMVTSNLLLVVSEAKRQIRKRSFAKGIGFLDYIQEGNEGIYDAIDGFDHRRGYKFSTYATWWLRQSMDRLDANHRRAIRLPVHIQEDMTKIIRIRKYLSKKLEQEYIAPEQIAAEWIRESAAKVRKKKEVKPEKERQKELAAMTTKVEKVMLSFEEADTVCSLEAMVGENPDAFGKILPDTNSPDPEEEQEYAQRSKAVLEELSTLPPREQKVLGMHFGIGYDRDYTLNEIGEQLNLTRERIRQIETQALRRMKRRPQLANFLPKT